MAERHELEITIGKDGKVNIGVKGIKGSKCLDVTKDLEEELGTVIEREKTSDFYQEEKGPDVHITGEKE